MGQSTIVTALELTSVERELPAMSRTKASTELRGEPFTPAVFFREAGTRETIESVLVAVMLALLFKAFETEAFVIPTGSMAPTLQGLHKDVFCDECDYEYRVSASSENPDAGFARTVIQTTCPICRHTQDINTEEDANEKSFSGDRIVVSKFAYDIAEPDRWEVVVFRYPHVAKQPYIKRLVGLPNEDLRVLHGDVYVQPRTTTESFSIEGNFSIARKDHRKLLAMLQPVDDTHYIAPALIEANWPWRWQQWDQAEENRTWKVNVTPEQPVTFSAAASTDTAWLRYRHLVPRRREWKEILDGKLPTRILDSQTGEAISDYYEYNDGFEVDRQGSGIIFNPDLPETDHEMSSRGLHWVGDLSMEVDLQVESSSGTVTLDLVEGGIHFLCQFDLSSGTATAWANRGRLSAEAAYDDRIAFDGVAAEGEQRITAATSLRGPGSYHIRYANVDNQLYLWVNERVVSFDHPGTYTREDAPIPRWSESDAGDAEPAGLGVQGATVTAERLRISRDIYYISVASNSGEPMDYRGLSSRSIRRVLDDPKGWSSPEADRMFAARDRAPATFELQADQFFMMGDNSPHSSDARMWSQKFVHRKDLIGKAVFIFWPHSWWRPVPFWPRFERMRFIR